MLRPPLAPTRRHVGFAGAAAIGLLMVDGLFAWKYGARLPVPLAAVLVAHAAALAVAAAVGARAERPGPYAALVAVVVLGAAASLAVVDPLALRVDRWEMVDRFLSNARAGVYPYTPRPGANIPGPLPVYYVLLAPFWALGEMGAATLAALVGYAALLRQWLTPRRAGVALAVLAASVPFLWEVPTRSTVFANAVLTAAVVTLLARWRPRSWGAVLAAGCLAGLVLSTRSAVAIPLAAAFAHVFLRDGRWGAFLAAGVTGAAVFALTLLPLYLWSPEGFARYNPLLVQSSFSSVPLAAGALVLAIGLGWRSRSTLGLLAAAGGPLFLTVAAVLVRDVLRHGWATVLWESAFDLSYFLLAVPFVLPVAVGWIPAPRAATRTAAPSPRIPA